ncbi:MAG: 4a-hydroxytetrahydrobiopterin dehydratase [Myxococcales bacterium]|nr:4a-hydroxytetrahydrobiopterin dehydratase [Myxococcales bacterium]MCB9643007.1 4a-hydroxytetrahydrobiopterin dehydratase [Myxococcales bacterium]
MSQAWNPEQIEQALSQLEGWRFEGDSLKKTFTFANFKEAMSFLVRLAFHAEEQDHHPEIFNVYNRVELTLRTHDAGNKVTEKDVKLAQTIEKFNWR